MTSFEKLEDKVISGLTAKYLRRKLDATLSPNCYSFRQDGNVDHLTAVRALVGYRKARAGEDLWVAECDIRKFFDTIDHRVALKAFDRLAKGKGVDPCARAVLVGYLKAYTVRTTLVKGAKPQSRAKCRAYVDKVREALASAPALSARQGDALLFQPSCQLLRLLREGGASGIPQGEDQDQVASSQQIGLFCAVRFGAGMRVWGDEGRQGMTGQSRPRRLGGIRFAEPGRCNLCGRTA